MLLKTLQNEMVAAMKAKDKARKDAISYLIAAVKKAAIDEGCRDNIPETLVDKVVLKEHKSIEEQINTCPPEREDLLSQYRANLSVVSEFVPKQLDENEVREIITTRFADILATKNKGMIIKAVMGELSGKANGKLINQIVAELCS